MNLNKYTQKAQEAVLGAQTLAEELNHSQVEALHLLAALLGQPDGVVPQIVNRVGYNLHTLNERVQQALQQQPRAIGATAHVGMSRELVNIVRTAEREAAQMKDEYVSTEHLFLALVEAAGKIRALSFLRELGPSRDQ